MNFPRRLFRVWSGGIQFRGKVWDFSQRNSLTQGTKYHLLEKAFVLSATNETAIPAGWTSSGVTTGSQWSFSNSSAWLASPRLDLTRYRNVMLSYFTPGSGKVLKVQVSTNDGATWTAQEWNSLTSPPQDGNQKQIAVTGTQVRFRFIPTGMPATGLQDVNLIGDCQAWTAKQGPNPLAMQIDWRGYRLINRVDGIVNSVEPQ